MGCITISLNDIFDIITVIQKTNSPKEKSKILLSNWCPEIRQIFCFVLNPYVTTGLSTKKINKNVEPIDGINTLTEAMIYLRNHPTGTDKDIAIIKGFVNTFPIEYQDIVKSILTKEINLGFSGKTINKVIGEEIVPSWEVQQAYSIDKYNLKDGEWFSLSEKLNGNRGTYKDGKIISRQGLEFVGLEHIIEDIQKVFPEDVVVDGELRRKNNDGKSDNENFTIGTGILNSDSEDKTSIEFIIFDYLTNIEFENGESDYTYKKRLGGLNYYRSKIEDLALENIRIVDVYYSGNGTYSNIKEWLDYAVKNDKEGLMLNRDTTYKCNRNNGILKVKKFYTMDLEVIDLEEGSGRLKNTLGAIVVRYKDNTVNVGSGFSDSLRKEIWSHKSDYIGRIAEVKYKEISKDKKSGKESLQFPVFISFRENGKEISYD